MLNITISKRSAFVIVLAMLLVVPAVAFANDVFDDVGDTGAHTDGISFMRDSGVSVGCDATNYCPSDNVTRAQMGTFMYRLSGTDPATPPSVDADRVDGYEAADMQPLVWAQVDFDSQGVSVTASGLKRINTIVVEAPVDGVLIVSGGVVIDNDDTAEVDYMLIPSVDGISISGKVAQYGANQQGTGNGELFTLSYTVATAVTAGTHTVWQEVGPVSLTSDFSHNNENLTVLFVPGGTVESVASPAGVVGSAHG